MARIDLLGRVSTSNNEEVHDKNERGKVSDTGGKREEGASSVTDADGHKRVVGPQDAERLVSQAGFTRAKKRKPGEPDFGDSASAPIPLPEDDVDPASWTQEALTMVQAQMSGQTRSLRRAKEGGAEKLQDPKSFFEALVVGAMEEPETDGPKLAILAENPPPDAEAMAAMSKSAQAMFGIELDGLHPGSQLLAASLLVAGQSDNVAVIADETAGKALDGARLVEGIETVVDRGRAAVEDGRRMNEGVSKNLSMQRTFVAKR